MRTSWAILLCKLRNDNDPRNGDDASEPFTREWYARFFAPAGAGDRNMAAYFRDASLGAVELGGTQVFGWYTLPLSRAEYTARVTADRDAGRNGLAMAARQAATAAGVDLGRFVGVVVCMNVPTDLFGSGGQVVCDSAGMQGMLLAHEMGHGYGLQHSRIDGSQDDYQDRWDIMSAANCFSAPDPTFGPIGPLMNAVNVRSRGWLPEARVWYGDAAGFDATIELRSLSRYAEPGFLAAELPGGLLVELRTREGWDAGIPRSAVMVHRGEGAHSYVYRGSGGREDLGVGEVFQRGDGAAGRLFQRVEVRAIDERAGTATLRVQHVPADRPSLGAFYQGAGDWLVWRAFDGGRWHGEEVFDNRHRYATSVTSQPCALSDWRNHRFAVYFRGADRRLRWKAHIGGRWHTDAAIEGGSELTSDPCVVADGSAGLAAFYRVADDALAWRAFGDERWHGEEVFGASHTVPTRMGSAPAAVAGWAGHAFAVFFRGVDGRLRWKAHHGGRWHHDALLDGGGVLTSAPAVVAHGPGELAVFYKGADDWLVWRAYSGGRWHGEEVFDAAHAVPTRMSSAPTVLCGWGGCKFAVFFRGPDGRLRWKAHHGGRWHGDALVDGGGALASAPSLAAFAP